MKIFKVFLLLLVFCVCWVGLFSYTNLDVKDLPPGLRLRKGMIEGKLQRLSPKKRDALYKTLDKPFKKLGIFEPSPSRSKEFWRTAFPSPAEKYNKIYSKYHRPNENIFYKDNVSILIGGTPISEMSIKSRKFLLFTIDEADDISAEYQERFPPVPVTDKSTSPMLEIVQELGLNREQSEEINNYADDSFSVPVDRIQLLYWDKGGESYIIARVTDILSVIINFRTSFEMTVKSIREGGGDLFLLSQEGENERKAILGDIIRKDIAPRRSKEKYLIPTIYGDVTASRKYGEKIKKWWKQQNANSQ